MQMHSHVPIRCAGEVRRQILLGIPLLEHVDASWVLKIWRPRVVTTTTLIKSRRNEIFRSRKHRRTTLRWKIDFRGDDYFQRSGSMARSIHVFSGIVQSLKYDRN